MLLTDHISAHGLDNCLDENISNLTALRATKEKEQLKAGCFEPNASKSTIKTWEVLERDINRIDGQLSACHFIREKLHRDGF